MNPLFEINKFKSFNDLYNSVEQEKVINLTNVKGGLQGFIALSVYNQAKESGRDTLLIEPTEAEARRKYTVLSRYVDDIIYLSPEQLHYYFSDAYSVADLRERQQALKEALSGGSLLAVCSMDALLKKLPEPSIFQKGEKVITKGEEVGYEEFIQNLSDYGYIRSYQTEAPGQFSVRGEIIDVFLYTEDNPVRFDFFDDEVETIKFFDITTQRSIKNLQSVVLTPVGENWLPQDEHKKALNKLENIYKNNETFKERFDMVESGEASANGILFAFLDAKSSFIDYLKTGADGKLPLIIWSDPGQCKEQAKDYLTRVNADYSVLSETGEAFKEEINRYFTLDEIEKIIDECPIIKLFLFEKEATDEGIELNMDSNTLESFAGQPKFLHDYLEKRLNEGYYIHFFAKNQAGLDKIKRYLTEIGIKETAPAADEPGIRFSIGEIADGFEMPQDKIVFLNESDFFKEPKKSRRKKDENTRSVEHFTDLNVGDFVVHDEYGIGRYQGIQQMDMGGTVKDMMHIEYAHDDNLYIPVEQMDLIQVYVGVGSDEDPELNELGSKKWEQAKKRARKSAENMAEELIELYSKRENSEGYAYSPDTVWQRDFEEAFPYEETDDQLQSILEVKEDMEKNVAMDRLLCGDVGFGKTEVAFRAAFKAAMEGKQTAILVPTTVLSQQHYLSALERFKDFPVTVEVLSRFKKPREQKEIIQKLKDGLVDIVIGTHRLLSKDIEFKDLGLLIVDEEQRFGVKSKEKLKQLKENVDVLTLSATPIPRTLHMSLSGVRDMSVLEEPPRGRRPVQTYVMKYSEPIIIDAIERELARGGQVYYIHNRIDDIDALYERLSKKLPNAKIKTAHGRMKGSELEDVMTEFLNHEFDILLSTTIVENGLDVQNANTLIVEEGDHFGLSQLYQLRGRVGRSPRQAYAYITHNKSVLNEDAAKRLKAIRDFTSFGSGFKVALRDLEIRGAGNILGKEQSGHMVKIGYELYTRILQEAIDEKMNGEVKPQRVRPSIQLNIQAYIPQGYVFGDEVKYNVYRKLARLKNWEEYNDLVDELKDRFGRIPQPVHNLMLSAMIKNNAAELDITNIVYRNNEVSIIFNSNEAGMYASQLADSDPNLEFSLWKKAGSTNKPAWILNIDKKGFDLLVDIYDFLAKLNLAKDNMQKRRDKIENLD